VLIIHEHLVDDTRRNRPGSATGVRAIGSLDGARARYLVGICKAPVFAFIIAVVGCFHGFRTRGGADSVGRQTTRSVVQSIFLVIVADALFSVAFSVLDL
jgi:hypothetical protein